MRKIIVLKIITLASLFTFFWAQFYVPHTGNSYVIPEPGCSSGNSSFIDGQDSTCSASPENAIGFPFIINQSQASFINKTVSVVFDLVPAVLLMGIFFVSHKYLKS